ncbi:MAG: arylesterase [Proteobacteria bacterium]|nr:arylesterase [Pseudomonadota bacterium]
MVICQSYFRVLCCLIFFGICHPCQGKPIILILGDSLSAAYRIPPEDGWVALLEQKLKKSYPDAAVINSSLVGDTTANGLQRLPSLLAQYSPDVVILELGGNDGLRGIPILNIKNNLSKMIELTLKTNAKVLLIGIKLPPNYGGAFSKAFYQNYVELSNQFGISLVPFILEGIALKPNLMLEDHIHPNVQAQPLILDNIWPYLNDLLS